MVQVLLQYLQLVRYSKGLPENLQVSGTLWGHGGRIQQRWFVRFVSWFVPWND